MSGEQEEAARVRLKHALDNLDGHVASVKDHAENNLPTSGVRQNLIISALTVVELLAIIDAFRNEREKRK